MIVTQNINPILKRTLKYLTLVAIAFAPIALLISLFPNFLTKSSQFITEHTWLLRSIRWSLLMLFVFSWDFIINATYVYKLISKEKRDFWKTKKLYIAFWLAIFEIVICENILLKLIRVF